MNAAPGPRPSAGSKFADQARQVERELYVLYFLMKDPAVPWYAKAVAAFPLAYTLSPIQIIPSFIPVIGLTDDVAVMAVCLVLMRKLVPHPVLEANRRRAIAALLKGRGPAWTTRARVIAGIVVLVWLLVAVVGSAILLRWSIAHIAILYTPKYLLVSSCG
jgi:uncharacterized membrane protein YkvA (DUF1232 family)